MSAEARPVLPPQDYVAALAKRKFKLEERIGSGAFGSVYQATQIQLNRRVAVKFFDRPYMDDPINRKRFDQEGLLLARVEHASIPYVITKGEVQTNERTVPYFVMQFVRGEPLSKILEKKKRLEFNRAAQIARGILSPLVIAHQNNVIHRDIKPDNIIIGAEGPFLIDFSIGICLKYEPGLTRASHPGRGVGTHGYASPEQIRNSGDVDYRTDIFSVGVVLFEMLVGHNKFDMENLDAQLSGCPPELRSVVRTACATDRTNRFADARTFCRALDDICSNPNVAIDGPMRAICPNPRCSSAVLSSREFLRGPNVIDSTTKVCCESCGTKLIKKCSKCGKPLPDNIRDLVVKTGKGGQDNISAYCGHCGTLFYETPTCKSCGSLLKLPDLKKDTKLVGCSKLCIKRQAASAPFSTDSASDDDIPF